eukprot:TRINITY_DN46377_c0_g1_i1.p1 TRINITY_DN46377_c0_g1~~TRINITY_DN46377_c0_g1_i1.p1  ORF type:complete len:985 (-),score=289.14 TRINITY_DN46377_c0_g1_i1:130-3084(-)
MASSASQGVAGGGVEVEAETPCGSSAAAAAPSRWQCRRRETFGDFRPLSLERRGPLSLELLERDLMRQVHASVKHVQKEMELLHAQLHREVRENVMAELSDAARKTATLVRCVRDETNVDFSNQICEAAKKVATGGIFDEEISGLRRKVEEAGVTRAEEGAGLRTALAEVRGECEAQRAVLARVQAQLLDSVVSHEEHRELVKRLRDVDASVQESQKLADASRGLDDLHVQLRGLKSRLDLLEKDRSRGEKVLHGELDNLTREEKELKLALEARLAAAEEASKAAEEASKAALEGLLREVERRTEEVRQENATIKADLEGKIHSNVATSVCELQQQVEEMRLELRQSQLDSSLKQLDAEASAVEQAEAAASAQAKLEAEQRTGECLGQLDERLTKLEQRKGGADESVGQLEQRFAKLENDCRDGLGFVQSFWARTVQWDAVVDSERLDRDGMLNVESPVFTAAGMQGLQLRLVLAATPPGRRPWSVGAYLRLVGEQAPGAEAQVKFKLTVCGQTQAFGGAVTRTSEWGSARFGVLNPTTKVPVKLELLDVRTPLPTFGSAVVGSSSARGELKGALSIADAEAAAQSASAQLASRLVRKIEWKVQRVSQHIQATSQEVESAADPDNADAPEPLLSPGVLAAGLAEEMQLMLYPVGSDPYGSLSSRPPAARRASGAARRLGCGFFLVCPAGTYVKCRAFVGKSERVFEHRYEARGPYGFDGWCTLADEVTEDDSVMCGVELLAVQHECLSSQAAAVEQQVKLTLNPDLKCMESVRVLSSGEVVPSVASPSPSLLPPSAAVLSGAVVTGTTGAARGSVEVRRGLASAVPGEDQGPSTCPPSRGSSVQSMRGARKGPSSYDFDGPAQHAKGRGVSARSRPTPRQRSASPAPGGGRLQRRSSQQSAGAILAGAAAAHRHSGVAQKNGVPAVRVASANHGGKAGKMEKGGARGGSWPALQQGGQKPAGAPISAAMQMGEIISPQRRLRLH